MKKITKKGLSYAILILGILHDEFTEITTRDVKLLSAEIETLKNEIKSLKLKLEEPNDDKTEK